MLLEVMQLLALVQVVVEVLVVERMEVMGHQVFLF